MVSTNRARLVVEVGEGGAGRDAVQVGGNRANVFGDRPFVVVKHHDEPLRLRPRVVQRFVADAAGQRSVTRYRDNVFVASAKVASHGHAQSGGESGPGVTRAVAVMFALGAQEEPIQSLVLAHGGDAIEPSA